MTLDDHTMNVMRYADGEMSPAEKAEFERHLSSCEQCRDALNEFSGLKEVTDQMRIADLPEAVWDKYWTGIYNRIERSVAWFLFVIGSVMMIGYSLFQALTDPTVETFVRLAMILMIVGFAILLLSVIREKFAVNRADRYISEVQR